MRFLFVMDPAETMHPAKDTTFAFMRGALARGHECFHCLPRDIANEGRGVTARARLIRVSDTPPHSELGPEASLELATLGAVFIRKDPPFDPPYVHLTHQLDLVKDRVLVVNDPRGLRDANEKLFAFHFTEHMPHSRVTADPREIIAFVDTVGGRAVLKPLDGAGGSGVVVLERGDKNLRSLADVWTSEGKKLALVQEYLPAIRTGDKRILVLDGKPLGAILRVPREDDVRANLHVGGRAEPTTLTPREQAAVTAIGPKLVEHGLYFVGLDFIGERLIEVNVTSPTGIQELGRFSGRPVEQDVIAWVEARVAARRA
ncbi:MAG TPA: glutathione synthase [Polyangiaceae bacterium]|nr:glutathione synthase [Polyangiaceae bacterium]